ncbi:ABC transporter ATP-binding protein [Clostridium tetani]|uniref:Transporter n=1 Tax=Clostridium tetani (strain Massachusetts / E88) TaxID=212717 RepID=Q897U2_CLOTE|nr:ATP-binding cassette domain-containing protein [Clostridium tetani]AAO35244.1 transporter [Clostridium tetani E88]KGI38500.1 ABC transporter [Clostridium tetani ATCC 9441]KGI40948.1 ABC transporter [Clostridium tetani]KGI41617.1 ABC transporter [Clostridium tetani]KGI46062.1 ABC transporter [Clostridium tetani]
MDQLNDVVVSIRDLKMSYGSKEVLKGINLDVKKGEIIGYIGPNGAGKSTTVKIMLGLVKGYEGEVKIFGNNISNDNVEYKRKIGYVPENGEIYDNLTAYEYVTFLGEIYDMELEEINNKAKKLMSLFGIEKSYHSRISSYSKGMRQKLLIISSLIHNPDILFLDEPLSGLDANSVLVFKEVLSKLASEGKTIFYSSHIMEVVEKISSRIILLNNGQIAADDTFEELKKKNMEGSLEQIFNQITGFTKHEEIANEFISILKEV